jgi:DNA repair exonuclease SbcCD nuclease subunit
MEKKPTAILTSDWHLREDTPICYTGDFQMEQWKSVVFVSELQHKFQCPVLHAGDLFNHWKPSPWLLAQAFDLLPKEFHTVYGQHDLPQHNWELRGKTGINCLRIAKRIKVLSEVHFGQEPNKGSLFFPNREPDRLILVWHHLTYNILPPFPGATGGNAPGILKKYSKFDLIVTGDNHDSFSVTLDDKLLVNPGPLTRQDADQEDYKPRVTLWYADSNTIKWVYLPIEKDVISREHIEAKNERDKRFVAFIKSLNKDWKVGTSFEDNLKEFFAKNKTDEFVKKIVYEAIGV